ncbi:MAG: hypothetical protein U9R38_02360 [Candidatus Margulisiibacteriota bacterium]|nr:hypothetical protein [Candidatus Margulisiibacteriota bacterium]
MNIGEVGGIGGNANQNQSITKQLNEVIKDLNSMGRKVSEQFDQMHKEVKKDTVRTMKAKIETARRKVAQLAKRIEQLRVQGDPRAKKLQGQLDEANRKIGQITDKMPTADNSQPPTESGGLGEGSGTVV